MKTMKSLLFIIMLIHFLVLAACGTTSDPITVVETVIVEKVVEGEAVSVIETVIVEKEVERQVVVTATPAEIAPKATSAPENETPKEGGILKIGNGYTLRDCDSHIRAPTTALQACGVPNLETLLTLENKTDFAPKLAESWEISEDSKTYTFNLRKGVTFHDGTPFNAEAVKVNFERIMDPEINAAQYSIFKNIVSIETPDEYTVVITLQEPDVGFLMSLVEYTTGIYSPAALEQWGPEIALHPVGTGPFIFESFTPEQQIYRRNDEYWGGKPYLEGVEFQVITDDVSRVLALESGAVDVILWVPEIAITELIERGYNMQSEPGQNFTGFALNKSHPPLDDIRVRQAILYALNREAFMDPIWQGRAIVNKTGIPPTSWAFDSTLEPYTYDPEKAKSLLDEAGWEVGSTGIREKDGQLLKLYFPVGSDIPRPQVALIAQAQLREVGIAADVTVIEVFSFYDQVYNCEHDITYWSGSPTIMDPALFFQQFHSDFARTAWCYDDPEMDELIANGLRTSNIEERNEIYSKIQQKILDDATVGWLAHYESPSATLQPYVRGWEWPLYRIFSLNKVWLDR